MGERPSVQRPYPKRQEQDTSRRKRIQSRRGVNGSMTWRGPMETVRAVLMGAIYIYQLSWLHNHAERQRAA